MKKFFRVIFLSLIFVTSLVSEIYSLGLSGYFENNLMVFAKDNGSIFWGDLNKIRLKIEHNFNDNLSFNLQPKYCFFIKSQEVFSFPIVSDENQIVLERAYLKANFPFFSVTAGKQRIAWGVGYIFNPTDIFNPFVLAFSIKEEDFSAIEAVRIQVPLGVTSNFDAFITTGSSFGEMKKGLRLKTNYGLFDFSTSFISCGNNNYQVGFDSEGEVFEAGVRAEICYKILGTKKNYFQIVLGGDYTFQEGFGLNIEYLYNQGGSAFKESYNWAGLYLGEEFLLARDYLFLNFYKTIDEITKISFNWLINLNDKSFLIYPIFSKNILENVDFSLAILFFKGSPGSEFSLEGKTGILPFSSNKLFLAKFIWSF